jgi:hypothetical protein
VNNWAISNMLVHVLRGMDNRRLNSLALDDRLNTFVNMVVGQMLGIRAALDCGALRRCNLLMIGDTSVHLLMTGGIFVGHSYLVMTMLGSELLMFVFGWQGSSFLYRLDAMLVMVNFVLTNDVLVDFLGLIGSNNFVSSLRLDLGVNGGIVVFTGGKNLNQKQVLLEHTSLILSIF